MTQIRFGSFAILAFLVFILSCNLFQVRSDRNQTPTQVVDLPSFIGKSREEVTKMVGTPPSKAGSGGTDWELPEGTITVRKETGKADQITYLLKVPYSGFVSSPEMAALANINVSRRKVNQGRGWQSYDDISVNGKTFDLALDNWGGRYVLARMTNIRVGGEVPEGFRPTQVVDLPQMLGKSRPEVTEMVGVPPFNEDNIAADWQLPEGHLMDFSRPDESSFYYKLNWYSDFDPNRGVGSPEEMAALVQVDLQGMQPEIREGYLFYHDLSVNGKTTDLEIYIDKSYKRYTGASISIRR